VCSDPSGGCGKPGEAVRDMFSHLSQSVQTRDYVRPRQSGHKAPAIAVCELTLVFARQLASE